MNVVLSTKWESILFLWIFNEFWGTSFEIGRIYPGIQKHWKLYLEMFPKMKIITYLSVHIRGHTNPRNTTAKLKHNNLRTILNKSFDCKQRHFKWKKFVCTVKFRDSICCVVYAAQIWNGRLPPKIRLHFRPNCLMFAFWNVFSVGGPHSQRL